MSAELPHFGTIWEVSLDRRKFLRLLGAAAGTAVLSCLPQSSSQESSLSKVSSQEEIFPNRTKLSEIVRWQEEGESNLKEIEKGVFLLGAFARLTSEGKVLVHDLQSEDYWEFQLPFEPAPFGGDLSFSPDGQKLAVFISTKIAEEHRFKPLNLFTVDLKGKTLTHRTMTEVFHEPSVSWSANGEFLLMQASTYEIASLPVNRVPLKGPKLIVARYQIGELENFPGYYEEKRVGLPFRNELGELNHGFSPDSRWVVTVGRRGDGFDFELRAFNLQTRENRFLFDGFAPEGAWCSLGKNTFVAFVDPDGGGLRELRLFDLATGQQRGLGDGSHLFRILPDRGSVLFIKDQQKIGLVDLRSSEKRLFSLSGDVRVGDLGHSTFSPNGQEFIFLNWNPQSEWFEIYVLNLVTGHLSFRQKLIRENGMKVEKFLTPEWLVLSTSVSDTSRWELCSLSLGKRVPLGQAKTNFPAELGATLLGEGNVYQSGEKSYFFSQGRKYPLAPQVAEFLNGTPVTPRPIPTRTVEQIPESVNKLEFRGGDLLLDREGGVRYLRDGQRYPVVDLGSFQNNVQFNRQRYEVPQVILKRIPEGKDPLEGKSGFSDWDGHFVEAHREGSILLLFVKGWKSASDDGPSFPELKGGLKENNCSTDGRMAEFTYNAKRKLNGELELLPYDSTHAAVVPTTPTKYLEWQLERYKELLPWTKIILVAHSLGGWLAFNAALNQAEAVRAVITLDSPLKGINKTLIGDRGEAILRGLWGDEVVNFLIKMGDEVPEEAIERRAKMLQERGVEVFTFASTDDLLVPHQVAFLENRTQSLNGSSLNLRFPMGRLAGLDVPWINPFFTGDPREELKEWLNTVVTAHGTVTRHPEVIKTIAKIVGKISS